MKINTLKDLGAIQVLHFATDQKSRTGQHRVHDKADQGHLPGDIEVLGGILRVVQCCDDHHRLSHRNDQGGKPLGCHRVNNTDLAADIAADHQEKQSENDG